MGVAANDNVVEGNSQTAQVRCTRIGEEPDQPNADNNTNYYDTPKYFVGVLGGAVSD